MSRSRRKTPISGITTATSDHPLEENGRAQAAHRVKQELNTKLELVHFPSKCWDLVNPWSSEKDRKRYWRDADSNWMLK